MQYSTGTVRKISKKIHYGNVVYFETASGVVKYHLVGIIEHQGSSIQHGHYRAMTKNGQSYFLLDDQNVSCIYLSLLFLVLVLNLI
jgi:ubiquitin C-terminal hydrolase